MLKCVTIRVCEGSCPGHSDIIVLLRSLLQVQCCFKMCERNLKKNLSSILCGSYEDCLHVATKVQVITLVDIFSALQ